MKNSYVNNNQKPVQKKKRHVFLILLIVLFVIIIASGIVLYTRYDDLIYEGDYVYVQDPNNPFDNYGRIDIREGNKAYFIVGQGVTSTTLELTVTQIDDKIYLVAIDDSKVLVEVSQYTLKIEDKVFERESKNMPFWLEKIIYVFLRDVFLKMINWYNKKVI